MTLLLHRENEHDPLGGSEHIPRYFVTTHWHRACHRGLNVETNPRPHFSSREKCFLLTFPLIEPQGGFSISFGDPNLFSTTYSLHCVDGIAAPEVRNRPTFREFHVSPFRRRPVRPASPSLLQRLPDAVSPLLDFRSGLWLTPQTNWPNRTVNFPPALCTLRVLELFLWAVLSG